MRNSPTGSAEEVRRSRMPQQRGIALIELALTLPILCIIVAMMLLLGIAFYKYSVMQSVASDAARYLSSAPTLEMSSTTKYQAHIAIANAIIAQRLGVNINGAWPAPSVSIICGSNFCNGYTTPTKITVTIQVPVIDDVFASITGNYVEGSTLVMTATSTMPYLGR